VTELVDFNYLLKTTNSIFNHMVGLEKIWLGSKIWLY